MNKPDNYDNLILVLIGGMSIDLSSTDAHDLLNDDLNNDYWYDNGYIFQRPTKPNPFDHAPVQLKNRTDEAAAWWHRR